MRLIRKAVPTHELEDGGIATDEFDLPAAGAEVMFVEWTQAIHGDTPAAVITWQVPRQRGKAKEDLEAERLARDSARRRLGARPEDTGMRRGW